MTVPHFPPLASALKSKTPAALPSPQSPHPAPAAPPPAPRVAAAPAPPPPAPESPAPDASTYDPRDRVFYHRSVMVFLGALRPASLVSHYEKGPGGKVEPPIDHDREQAKEAAHACAAVLDRGIVPKGFVLPDIAVLEGLIRDREILDAAARNDRLSYATGHTVPNPQHYAPPAVYPPTVTEGQRAKMRERLDAIPSIPSRAEAAIENERKLGVLTDLSETVRAHALDAAALRIASRKDLTGAPTCRQEVIGVVVDAILDSIETANQLGLPSRDALSYSEEESEGFVLTQFPYGTHLAVGVAVTRDEVLKSLFDGLSGDVAAVISAANAEQDEAPDTGRPGQGP